jgi:hypothetical protein
VNHHRVRLERRLAAVTLAARLYRLDHGGAWPASLDALAPHYLPRVPADPFDAAGKPLKYVVIPKGQPDGTDRPIVYSVADDGADDTAAGRGAPPAWPLYDWNYGTSSRRPLPDPDQWRDLSRWANPPPLPGSSEGGDENSTEAVDDQGNKSDDPGKDADGQDRGDGEGQDDGGRGPDGPERSPAVDDL